MEKYKIVDLYNDGLSLAGISRQTGFSLYIVRNYLKNNVDYNVNKSSRELELEVKNLYESGLKNIYDISQKLNKPYVTIHYIFKRLKIENIKKELYNVDEDFFEIIDNEAKAYFLGMMYSDGCVYKNTMIIGVTDQEIVENAKEYMQYEGPIELYKKDEKCKMIYKLRIRRKKIFEDLIDKGCYPNKSLTLKFPDYVKVPKFLMNHFIRGIFDGDACISEYDGGKAYITKKWVITITGTREILEGIIKETNITPVIINVTEGKNTWRIYINKKLEIKNFIQYLYQDSSIHLKRKKNMSEIFMSKNNDK